MRKCSLKGGWHAVESYSDILDHTYIRRTASIIIINSSINLLRGLIETRIESESVWSILIRCLMGFAPNRDQLMTVKRHHWSCRNMFLTVRRHTPLARGSTYGSCSSNIVRDKLLVASQCEIPTKIYFPFYCILDGQNIVI